MLMAETMGHSRALHACVAHARHTPHQPDAPVLVLRYPPSFSRMRRSAKMARLSQRPDPWILTSRGRRLAMVMVADSLPGLKRWLAPLGLKDGTRLLVIRMVVAFVLHAGRMSCLRAAGAVRCEPRHRAQISRFLARPRWRQLDL